MHRKLVKCNRLKTPYKIKLVTGKGAIVEKAWISPYQLIEIVLLFGRDGKKRKGLFLDGEVQFVEGEIDYEYHIRGHLKHFPASGVRKIAILGGGDGKLAGYLARKYPNVTIYILELDPCMVHIFKTYYPHLNNNAFNRKNVKVVIGDAYENLKKFSDNYFDLIISDLPDIVSPEREKLYTDDKFELISSKLRVGGHWSFYTGGLPPAGVLHALPRCIQLVKTVPIKGFLGAIGYVMHLKKVNTKC